ncbi:hypothetical protein [Thioclava sp. DLFJ4-1]|uniref:hypothetical protein n=1 Tax=Thioclava sp. DLFJ4-1 TaxID=1915313 RepID=UPI0009982C5E|nr:hypothetical protein [Thioclava sp. DLFJ4-1]OOY16720.1 hypothetical protein BMI85_06545 [Thioclava sp. DLFJ4-1]
MIKLAAASVIAASAIAAYFFISTMHRESEARQAAQEAVKSAELQRDYLDCLPLVYAWDQGDKKPALAKYGSAADSGVEFCRATIKIFKAKAGLK